MPASPADPGASHLERALAAAAAEPGRIAEVLTELKAERVWIPLPGPMRVPGRDGGYEAAAPVRPDGSVILPTVTYQGREFVPAFTSAERLREWTTQAAGADAEIPHLVVSAAALARLLPARLGIAVNPNAGPSVALSPAGVCELARSDVETHRP